MATRRAARELTPAEQEQFDEAHQEFMSKPLDYVRHDSNARYDDSLRHATAKYGMAFYGSWWLLVELLSANKLHSYRVIDEDGWKLFAIDMSSVGIVWTVDECKQFCERLAEHGLIDAECFGRGTIVNNRVCREVDKYARAAAGKSLGAWKTNRPK